MQENQRSHLGLRGEQKCTDVLVLYPDNTLHLVAVNPCIKLTDFENRLWREDYTDAASGSISLGPGSVRAQVPPQVGSQDGLCFQDESATQQGNQLSLLLALDGREKCYPVGL